MSQASRSALARPCMLLLPALIVVVVLSTIAISSQGDLEQTNVQARDAIQSYYDDVSRNALSIQTAQVSDLCKLSERRRPTQPPTPVQGDAFVVTPMGEVSVVK